MLATVKLLNEKIVYVSSDSVFTRVAELLLPGDIYIPNNGAIGAKYRVTSREFFMCHGELNSLTVYVKQL